MQWKLALYYDAEKNEFVLGINDIAFLSMPYKPSLDPPGPQNIETGSIKLNGVEVHKGYTQYTVGMMDEWRYQKSIESVTEARIGDSFACSSSEALNLVFEDLARNIDHEFGLKKFEIINFTDQNTLEEWPLSQLVLRCHKLQQLTIMHIEFTTAANMSQLLNFAGLAATSSDCLDTLWIDRTRCSAEDGDKFFEVLADHDNDKLKSVTINSENDWFAGDRDGCMAPLLVLLARQTSLTTLKMPSSSALPALSDAQKDQIRKVVSESAPECTIEFPKVKIAPQKSS